MNLLRLQPAHNTLIEKEMFKMLKKPGELAKGLRELAKRLRELAKITWLVGLI